MTWTPEKYSFVTGFGITTPERTAFDLGRSMSVNRSIPILDALSHATNFKVADVVSLAVARPGSRGIRRLQSVLKRVDGGAESPQESRVRLLLVAAGLSAARDANRVHRRVRYRANQGRHGMAGMAGRCRVRRHPTLVRPISAVVGYRSHRDARGDGMGGRQDQRRDAVQAGGDHRTRAQQTQGSGLSV